MKIECIISDNQKNLYYDASSLLLSATWSGEISGQPGKLEFDVIRDGTLQFYEGSQVSLKVDGYPLFLGWVFSKSRTDRYTTSVTAYDQMRYLKNTGSYVLADLSASDIFAQLCAEYGVKHRIVHPSGHLLPSRPYDNKTLGDIIQTSLDLTLIEAGKWYYLRDNFGTLEFLDIARQKTNLVVGEASLMTGYDYQTSIDDDTYNRIKLVQKQTDSGSLGVYIVGDTDTIGRWGLLQLYESVDENMNEAQIAQRAEQLLKAKNRVTRKLSLNCLGDFRVMPGNGVWVETGLDDMQLSRYMIVHACSHTIKNQLHTMQITLEVAE